MLRGDALRVVVGQNSWMEEIIVIMYEIIKMNKQGGRKMGGRENCG